MTLDRYTKAILTIIAACLVWIALNGVPGSNVQAQASKYQLAGDGSERAVIYRLDTQSGEVVRFVMGVAGRPTGKVVEGNWQKEVVFKP